MKKKRSKRYKQLLKVSNDKKIETVETAIKKIKDNCTTKFDELVERRQMPSPRLVDTPTVWDVRELDVYLTTTGQTLVAVVMPWPT